MIDYYQNMIFTKFSVTLNDGDCVAESTEEAASTCFTLKKNNFLFKLN